MKTLKNYINLSIVLLVFMPTIANSQQLTVKDTAEIKLINIANKIMSSAKTCALITLDSEGRPRARMMDPFPPEQDLTVWLGTNPKSRKVAQITADQRVTLYYVEQNSSGYVMLQGIATLVDDPIEKEKRWKDAWSAFYPNRTDSYLLIKVKPTQVEVVSYTYGIVGDTVTWKPPVIQLNSDH